MNYTTIKRSAFMLPTLLIIVFYAWGKSATPAKPANQAKTHNQQNRYDDAIFNVSRTFSEALHLVKTKYYLKDFDPTEAMFKAINTFVSLDPHSTFLDPKTYKEILESTSGEFFGIGVAISNKASEDEFLAVIDTIPDGPADKAGLKPGDKIIEVEGLALRGMATDEATAKLKGERNSVVHLKIIREHSLEPLSFNITRDVVKEKSSLCYYIKDYQIYYLQLNTFSRNAVTQLAELLKKSQKQSSKGIILDLRNNLGGLLTSAIEIAGLFVDKQSLVVVTKDRNNKVIEQYSTEQAPIATNGVPIFILINNYTASAAEILAGVLKIHSDKIAKQTGNKKQQRLLVFLAGTKTFGKGSVQEVIPISNDCAVKLTTALYFLPDDTTIQGIGIEPDIEIERKFPPPSQLLWINQFYGRESALKNSIKIHATPEQKKTSKEPEKNWKERRKETLAADTQIRDTISCINILNLNPQAWHNRIDAIKLIKNTLVAGDTLMFEDLCD